MKGPLLVLVALAAGLAGGVAASLLGLGAPPPGPTEEASEGLRAADVERIVARMLEERPAPGPRLAPAPAATASSTAPGSAEATLVPPVETSKPTPEAAAGFLAELLARLDADEPYDRTKEGRLFGYLSANPEQIDAAIRQLKERIAADARDPDLHVALATAYVAQLVNETQPGPQQGQVWRKASAAYDAALALEPEHWQARFGKAFGTSQIPAFLGQRPAAIRQFEELLEIQDRQTPAPEHAETFFHLGTLYKDAGNVERAQEIWREGLRRFPEADTLREALTTSGGG